ncbi:hypothetical protein ACFL0C_01435, partial [Patescibacteria group bacterium]
ATIILSSKTEDALLPTVISRCKKINLNNTIKELSESSILEEHEKLKSLNTQNMGQRLEIAEVISKKDREEIINILSVMVISERKLMLDNPQMSQAENITKILHTLADLETTNVNVRLALENLFLHIK